MMPRIARIVGAGYPHHIVQRGNNRERVFLDSMDYEKYLCFLSKYSEVKETTVLAYCLMPNHVHLLVRPSKEEALAMVVLDSKENIVSWNYKAEDLWGLRAEEVHGRSLLSLDIGLPVEKMKVGIRACLIGESDHEEVALDAVNRRGKSIKCRVTCTPIVGASKERHGVILMMEEQG
jgi:PAS domain S-box-containing protein